jgi:membrane protein
MDSASSTLATRLRNRVRFLVDLFSDTADRFSENEGFRLVAAFSYYATFSIFPLILLATTVVGFVLGESDAARDRLLDAIASNGSPIREVVDRSLAAMQASRNGRGISAILGLATLLFAASGAFVELDAALNKIWCVPLRQSKGIGGSIRLFIRERLSGFAIVAAMGLTLLVSLVASSILQRLADTAQKALAIPLWPAIMRASEVALSLLILATGFTLMFHLIPRSRPPVRIVVRGAILTTVGLMALKELFAAYLGNLTSYSAYGVAGGTLALATWIYLSTVVIFFGAQLTERHADRLKKNAIP